MNGIIFKQGIPQNFPLPEREYFQKMLLKQGKVKNPSLERVNRCKLLCACYVDDVMVSIGAIKPKTAHDFGENRANMPQLEKEFSWELGYCYTEPNHTRKGYSSTVIAKLLDEYGAGNLMATTEVRADNSMVGILERASFKRYGQVWESGIHHGLLGLFLRRD